MATGNYSYWKNCLTMIRAGTGITVDNSDPMKPIINATGGGGGGIESIVAGDNITVDDTDPLNPIINAGGGLPKVFMFKFDLGGDGETPTYTVLVNTTGRTHSNPSYATYCISLSGTYTDNYFVSINQETDEGGTDYIVWASKFPESLDGSIGAIFNGYSVPFASRPYTIKIEIYE